MNALIGGQPALAKGQVWQRDSSFIRIGNVGRHLVEYREMKILQRPGRGVRSRVSAIRQMQQHLLKNHATLVEDSDGERVESDHLISKKLKVR